MYNGPRRLSHILCCCTKLSAAVSPSTTSTSSNTAPSTSSVAPSTVIVPSNEVRTSHELRPTLDRALTQELAIAISGLNHHLREWERLKSTQEHILHLAEEDKREMDLLAELFSKMVQTISKAERECKEALKMVNSDAGNSV